MRSSGLRAIIPNRRRRPCCETSKHNFGGHTTDVVVGELSHPLFDTLDECDHAA